MLSDVYCSFFFLSYLFFPSSFDGLLFGDDDYRFRVSHSIPSSLLRHFSPPDVVFPLSAVYVCFFFYGHVYEENESQLEGCFARLEKSARPLLENLLRNRMS